MHRSWNALNAPIVLTSGFPWLVQTLTDEAIEVVRRSPAAAAFDCSSDSQADEHETR
jgi:hypothetical protein